MILSLNTIRTILSKLISSVCMTIITLVLHKQLC